MKGFREGGGYEAQAGVSYIREGPTL